MKSIITWLRTLQNQPKTSHSRGVSDLKALGARSKILAGWVNLWRCGALQMLDGWKTYPSKKTWNSNWKHLIQLLWYLKWYHNFPKSWLLYWLWRLCLGGSISVNPQLTGTVDLINLFPKIVEAAWRIQPYMKCLEETVELFYLHVSCETAATVLCTSGIYSTNHSKNIKQLGHRSLVAYMMPIQLCE